MHAPTVRHRKPTAALAALVMGASLTLSSGVGSVPIHTEPTSSDVVSNGPSGSSPIGRPFRGWALALTIQPNNRLGQPIPYRVELRNVSGRENAIHPGIFRFNFVVKNLETGKILAAPPSSDAHFSGSGSDTVFPAGESRYRAGILTEKVRDLAPGLYLAYAESAGLSIASPPEGTNSPLVLDSNTVRFKIIR